MNTQRQKIHQFDEVFDAQKVFRLVLEAMANPGRLVDLAAPAGKMFGEEPALLALAMTFLDNEVSFWAGDDGALSGQISQLTLCRKADISEADFLFLTDGEQLEQAVQNAKCGSLRDPHKSATLIVRTEILGSEFIALSGPGIRDLAELAASPDVVRALLLRKKQAYEYPQGIDFLFIDSQHRLMALPRLVGKEEKKWDM